MDLRSGSCGVFDMGRTGLAVRFRFVFVSGLGWLLDTVVYTVLVAFGLRVMASSMIGGLCGATFAFLTSSRFVFAKSGNRLPLKLALYLAYSLALILVAAWLTEALTDLLFAWAEQLDMGVSLTPVALVSKCLITPFLLAMNFVVARTMLQRTL